MSEPTKGPWELFHWNSFEIYAKGKRIATVESEGDANLIIEAHNLLNLLHDIYDSLEKEDNCDCEQTPEGSWPCIFHKYKYELEQLFKKLGSES